MKKIIIGGFLFLGCIVSMIIAVVVSDTGGYIGQYDLFYGVGLLPNLIIFSLLSVTGIIAIIIGIRDIKKIK